MLAEIAPTWVAARRSDAATAACVDGSNLLLMDDGLQHLSLHRDLSLLCVDSSYLFGNGRVLPAGLAAHEPAARALMRSDAVIAVTPYTTVTAAAATADAPSAPGAARHGIHTEAALRAALCLPDHLPVLRATLEPEPGAVAQIAGRPVVAFSGTARPQRFFDTLRALGCSFPCQPLALPDHAPLDGETLKTLRRDAATHRAPLVTTVKDAMRLRRAARQGVHQLSMRLRLLGGAEEALDRLLVPLTHRVVSQSVAQQH